MPPIRVAELDTDETTDTPPVEPVVVAPTHKTARVKGTWTQYYGAEQYNFVDGKRYTLPIEVFNYLRSRGCIYDTL